MRRALSPTSRSFSRPRPAEKRVIPPPARETNRLSTSGGVELFSSRYGPAVRAEEGATYRAKKLHDRHVAVRTKRMVRGFICCTQVKAVVLKLVGLGREQAAARLQGREGARASRCALERRNARDGGEQHRWWGAHGEVCSGLTQYSSPASAFSWGNASLQNRSLPFLLSISFRLSFTLPLPRGQHRSHFPALARLLVHELRTNNQTHVFFPRPPAFCCAGPSTAIAAALGQNRGEHLGRAPQQARCCRVARRSDHPAALSHPAYCGRVDQGAGVLGGSIPPTSSDSGHCLLCLVPLRVLPQTLCVSSGHHSSPTRRRSSRPPTQARHDVRRTRARLAEYVHLLGCKQASSRPTHLVIACSLARNTRVLSYRESLDYAHRLGTYRFRFPEYSTCIPSGCKHGYLGEEAIVMGCSGLVSNHRQQFFAQYKCALFHDAVATRAYVTDDHNGNNKAMTMSGTLGCLGCSRRCKAARRRLSWSTNPGRRKGIQWQNPARVDANRFETRPEENAPLRPPSKLARRKPSATPSSG